MTDIDSPEHAPLFKLDLGRAKPNGLRPCGSEETLRA